MLKQQAPKPFQSVGAAGTSNSFTLGKDHFLPYSYRTSFCLLSQAHAVLWRKSSVSSHKHCQAGSMSLTMLNHVIRAISFLQHSNSHTPLLSIYTRVRLLEKHLSSLKIDLRVICTSILEMNHLSNEVQLRSFQTVNAYCDPIIIYVN